MYLKDRRSTITKHIWTERSLEVESSVKMYYRREHLNVVSLSNSATAILYSFGIFSVEKSHT